MKERFERVAPRPARLRNNHPLGYFHPNTRQRFRKLDPLPPFGRGEETALKLAPLRCRQFTPHVFVNQIILDRRDARQVFRI